MMICAAHLVASLGHDVGCRVGVGVAAVGEHNVLPDADPADDGLTDLPAPMTTTTLILLPRWFFYAWFCRARSWEPSASPRYLSTICCMCSG
jgi:hypothetical protein